ncbi:hypothetical protein [Prochlorococcus marinus]|uniref:hypothetical protein n=1 Tax=Prochlorococcus marinus TaxID=1219 RepID=UPI0022B49368|nr:hypothetical protein [Prochlorococcus marinus]
MKSFLSYAIALLFIFIELSSQVHGFENIFILDKSQILIANKYDGTQKELKDSNDKTQRD